MVNDWRSEVQSEVDRLANEARHALRVLDAGGGKKIPVEIASEFHLTVIDLDPAGIAINPVAHERIVADIQSYDYGTQRFDLVLCWDVLEHLPSPERALRRIAFALAPGGLLVIKGPVPRSIKSIIANATPFWFHVAFHKWILGSRNAGRPGYAPYPLHFSSGSDDDAIGRQLEGFGLEIFAVRRFEGNHARTLRRRAFPLYLIYRAASAVLLALTGGAIGGVETDFYLLARMPGGPGRRPGEIPREHRSAVHERTGRLSGAVSVFFRSPIVRRR